MHDNPLSLRGDCFEYIQLQTLVCCVTMGFVTLVDDIGPFRSRPVSSGGFLSAAMSPEGAFSHILTARYRVN